MKKVSLVLMSLLTAGVVNYYSFAQTKKPAAKGTAKTTASKTKKATKSITPEEIEEGKNLIAKSDCLACHKVDVNVVGPAYKAVAAKYPATDANITKLSDKIIKGGAGVWGQIPMTPHPAISPTDASKMVKYILSVK